MAQPQTHSDLPSGVIRSSFSAGRLVWLVQSDLPFANNTEITKLSDIMTATNRRKKYWIFSLLSSACDKTGNVFTIALPNPHLVKSVGSDGYDGAEAQYETWAKTDCGKSSVKRKLDGLLKIGKED